MANPEWFFSTLAQSSAAIAGLVIAFTAVLYQLERQRRERRTDDLRELLRDFRERYRDLLRAMMGIASNHVDIETGPLYKHAKNYDASPEELERIIEDNNDVKKGEVALFFVHLNRILRLTSEIKPDANPKLHYLITNEQFRTLYESVVQLNKLIDSNDFLIQIYNNKDINIDDVDDPAKVDIFETHTSGFSKQENLIKAWIWDNAVEFPYEIMTGRNIYSISIALDTLARDFNEIDSIRINTILEYSAKNIFRILVTSGMLIFIGVIIPIMFLITLPLQLSEVTITGWPLLLIQTLLLIMCGGIIGYLLWLVYQNLRPPTN